MQDDLRPGVAVRLGPGLRRVVAPNPSALTGPGTNSYIVGEGRVALIDPGPDDARHAAALRDALGLCERIGWIILTHRHRDHAGLARAIAQWAGVPVLGGPASGGAAMPDFMAGYDIGGGEGVDPAFSADASLDDGAQIDLPGWPLRVLHTPGHLDDHICLIGADWALSGDHVMGWSSSIVSPPDGDMGDYMTSLERLASTGTAALWPGHGEGVPDARGRIAALAAHRRAREAEILAILSAAPARIADIVAQVYVGTPPGLHAAAARNVLAHLVDLARKGRIRAAAGTETAITSVVFAPAG